LSAQYALVTLLALWALARWLHAYRQSGKGCNVCGRPTRSDRPRYCPGCALVYGDGN